MNGESDILRLINDYVGRQSVKDVRTARELSCLLSIFIKDTPFITDITIPKTGLGLGYVLEEDWEEKRDYDDDSDDDWLWYRLSNPNSHRNPLGQY